MTKEEVREKARFEDVTLQTEIGGMSQKPQKTSRSWKRQGNSFSPRESGGNIQPFQHLNLRASTH